MQYTQPNLLTALEEGTFSFAYGISPWLFGAVSYTHLTLPTNREV